MITIDARGVSCPEPLIMLKKALKTESALVLLVDSKNANENCKSFATKQGFTVNSIIDGDTFTLQINKKV